MKKAYDNWSPQELAKFLILDGENSCGQGFNPHHSENPHHEMLTEFGLVYSHTTVITAMDGSKFAHHTYSIPSSDWYIGVSCRNGFMLCSSRSGSGRIHTMNHHECKRYLKRKLRELSV